jgi:hypothetical protein
MANLRAGNSPRAVKDVRKMSYIPKYILKRMFAEDAIKKTDTGLEITMLNVISPLSVDEIPDDVENYIEIKIDGEALDTEIIKGVSLTVVGNTYTMDNIKDFVGVVIPVGETIVLNVPVTTVEVGEEHEFEVTIKTQHPFQIQVKKTIA